MLAMWDGTKPDDLGVQWVRNPARQRETPTAKLLMGATEMVTVGLAGELVYGGLITFNGYDNLDGVLRP